MKQRRPPRITADTWDPVGDLAAFYRDTWNIRGVLVPGGDWHWRLARRRPAPPGGAAAGLVDVWEGCARPERVRDWLIDQTDAWNRWQQP
ncbi:hypothetical protein [Streptomonospora salina]|uniref:Uncharacterized protein n=1 Tax=Streptomonospora salina TaxID=104205 RepID=A0A841E9R0_9ACTN|nr:hypothetical protein [Streptomonospora salina]MBB5997813.1 hypothetical protein [Streptomonospora salina]